MNALAPDPRWLAALTASLQASPVDVLYLVCHGYIANGQTILCLEKPDGSLVRTNPHLPW